MSSEINLNSINSNTNVAPHVSSIKEALVPTHEQEHFPEFPGQYLLNHFADSSSCKFPASQELVETLIKFGPEWAANIIQVALGRLGFKLVLSFSFKIIFDLFSGQSCVRESIITDEKPTIGRFDGGNGGNDGNGFVTGWVALDVGRIECVVVRIESPDGKPFNLLFHLGSGPLTLVSRSNKDVHQVFSSTPRSDSRKVLAFGVDETIVLHTGNPDEPHTLTISPNK